MSQSDDPGKWSLWRSVILDNAAWILPAAGLIGVVVTFILGGWTWVVIGVFLVLVIACIALMRTTVKLNTLRNNAEARVTDLQQSATASAALEANSQGGSAHTQPQLDEQAKQAPTESETSEAATKPVVNEATDHHEGPQDLALVAALSHDLDTVDHLMKPWIESAEDGVRTERQGFYAYLQVIAGRHSEMTRLVELAGNNPNNSAFAAWIAMALDWLGEPLRAADEIARRRGGFRGTGRLFLREAQLRRRVGQPAVSLDLARSALDSDDLGADAKAAALAEEGYALEDLGRRFESFASFEQALEIDPGNADLRFHLAYWYSNSNWNLLALTHYLILISQGATGMAANNLGVALQHFSLPILAIDNYRHAAESGVALARGNLAVKFIDGGFIEEAMSEIGAGEKLDSSNNMVVAALSRVRSDRETQEGKRDELARVGALLRKVFARFDLRTPSVLPDGEYITEDGVRVVFAVDGSEAKGNFGEWAATAKLDQGFVQLSLKKGAILSASASGFAVTRDTELMGYLLDYPAKGVTTPFIASRTGAP